jgi:hypothetical protein
MKKKRTACERTSFQRVFREEEKKFFEEDRVQAQRKVSKQVRCAK